MSDKLADVLESSAGVSEDDAWTKQILVVIAYADEHVESLRTAAAEVDPAIAADTIPLEPGDDAACREQLRLERRGISGRSRGVLGLPMPHCKQGVDVGRFLNQREKPQ